MFAKTSNKVTFEDQQLDDYVLENSVLKSKLQSKLDALAIMSKELDKCSMERDRYKVLVEQLKSNKHSAAPGLDSNSLFRFSPNSLGQGDMFAKTSDQNCFLKLEVESLRSKLEEALDDTAALRKELQKKDTLTFNGSNKKVSSEISHNDYEQLVQELEKIQKKYQQLKQDYRATLDEKEELSADRDYYKTKVQRLNQQISCVLNRMKSQSQANDGATPKPVIDIDAIVMENKYLHERITQLEVEKEVIKRTLNKYKTLLDNRSRNERSFNVKNGFADVMTQRQVREFLERNTKTGSKRSSVAELTSLCLGLFEAVNDKAIALQHQRKTNQILADRISELEKTLESWCNGQKYIPAFPSEILLEDLFPDHSISNDDSKDTKSIQESENVNFNHLDMHRYDDDPGSSPDVRSDTWHLSEKSVTTKTVLPLELELLVKEALAEMNLKSDASTT